MLHRYFLRGLFALCATSAVAATPDTSASQSSLRENLLRQEYFASANHAGLQAPNRALGIRSYFQGDGVRVVARDPGETPQFDWRLQVLRRGDVQVRVAVGAIRAQDSRVELHQDMVTQTFDNGSDGLHAVLRIDSAPRGDGILELGIDLGVASASASGTHDVRLTAAAGRTFRLGDLRSSDAEGHVLPLTASVPSTGALTLRIDDTNAVYPLSVDTVITTASDIRIESDQVSAHFATSVAALGDVNLDGIGDFAIGAPDWDGGQTDEGAVFIFYGNTAWSTASWGLFAGNADKRLEMDQAGARFGASVAGAGDVNHDGVMDLVVGAPRFDNGSANEGAAFVYSGFDILFNTPILPAGQLEANRSNAAMGSSVAGVGDANGDGFDDVVVGAPGFQLGTTLGGRAFLFYGGAGVSFDITPDETYSESADGAQLGASVAGAGDVNGDGRADVLVGAPQAGFAKLYRGGSASSAVLFDSDVLYNGLGTEFGTSVAGAGDVNGDGYADMLISAPLYSNGQAAEGGVFVFFGGAGVLNNIDAILESNQAGSGFGSSLAGAGDVNGDGYADIVVGAPQYDQSESNEGHVFVYLGRLGAFVTTAKADLQINQVDAVFGSSLALGDIDGDGYDDVLAGAPYADFGHSDEGALFVYRGGGGKLDSTFDTSLGGIGGTGQSVDYFGFSVDGAGDVNADGYDDVIVGAPLYDGGEMDEGRVSLYLGSTAGLSATPWRTLEVNQANAHFGHSVAAAGDINGDGYGDVVAGAPYFDDGQNDEGTVFVYFGGLSMNTVADARYESNSADARLGWSVAGAGDVNGDGYADVIAGAPNWGASHTGEAVVFFGGTGQLDVVADAVLAGGQTDGGFGAAVAGAGDVNGDGLGDVIVGAPTLDVVIGGNLLADVGRVSLYLGAPGDFDTQSDYQLFGDEAGAQFGYSLAGAGDVNGDAFDDVIVGAPFATNGAGGAGKASVYFGARSDLATPLGTNLTLSTVAQNQSHSGFAVDGAGDVNRDGFADVLVGTPLYSGGSSNFGLVTLYNGAASGMGSPGDYLGLNIAGGNLGHALAGAGDINGDGFADVVVGAPFVQSAVQQPGIVRVFLGGDLPGRDLKLQQLLDGAVPIQPWGSAGAFTGFSVAAQGVSPRGREMVKLEVQACPAGVDYFNNLNGCRTAISAAWSDSGLAGIPLAAEFSTPLAWHRLYHWRARLLYAPVNSNGGSQPAVARMYGPWLSLRAQADNADVRIIPLASDTIFFDDFE